MLKWLAVLGLYSSDVGLIQHCCFCSSFCTDWLPALLGEMSSVKCKECLLWLQVIVEAFLGISGMYYLTFTIYDFILNLGKSAFWMRSKQKFLASGVTEYLSQQLLTMLRLEKVRCFKSKRVDSCLRCMRTGWRYLVGSDAWLRLLREWRGLDPSCSGFCTCASCGWFFLILGFFSVPSRRKISFYVWDLLAEVVQTHYLGLVCVSF